MTKSSTEEAVLLKYLQEQTPETLRHLIEAHQDRVYNLCFQVLRHVQDAEDAAQRTLLKVAEGGLTIRNAAGFRSWVYRVAWTTSLDLQEEQVRRRGRHRSYAHTQPAQPRVEFDPELQSDLHRAVATLEEDVRDLVVQHYFERASLTDLAARENCSRAAVWKKIEKGRSRLREILLESQGALGATAVVHLESIVPVKAPPALFIKGAPTLPLTGISPVPGGFAMATKGIGLSKAVSAAILLAALGLTGGILMGHRRAQEQIKDLEDRLHAATAELGSTRGQMGRIRAELARSAQGSGPLFVGAKDPSLLPGTAIAAPSAPASKTPGTDLKQSLRLLVRASLKARRDGKTDLSTTDPEMADPELQKAIITLVPYFMAAQNPCREAAKYTEFGRCSVEAMLEETGVELSPDQKRALSDCSERIRSQLDQGKGAPGSQQAIAVLQAERDFESGIQGLLTPDQSAVFISSGGYSMFHLSSEASDLPTISGENAAQTIVKGWASKYGLDEAEQIAAQPAARVVAEAISRLDQEYSSVLAPAPGDEVLPTFQSAMTTQTSVLDYRIRALQAQLEALGQLEGVVTPDQRARIQNAPPAEYIGPVVHGVLSPPPKK